ncbi:MAG: cytochrome c3 family protein, partial [Deltaproteobacteria bacterium]|nr:cytochrome c3 family protein [Deltaproteobacteria bacterium]
MSLDHKPVFSLKYIPLILLLAFSACFLIAGSRLTSAQDENEEKENHEIIIIENNCYRRDRKGPVRFEHVKHARDYKISCWECHHDYDKDGINAWSPWEESKGCSECHDP